MLFFRSFLEAKTNFCSPKCLSFADNWVRLQCCVVVVNANPVSGNDAKLADYVSSVLLKISTLFQIKIFRFSRHFQDQTQELDTHLSYQPAAASYPGLFVLSELPREYQRRLRTKRDKLDGDVTSEIAEDDRKRG